VTLLLLVCFGSTGGSSTAVACAQPTTWSVAAAFDLSANGIDEPTNGVPPAATVHSVPTSLLKAIGWVESGWRQFTAAGRPVVSPDFGYGIMQVTSGMAGAFGSADGDLPATTQSRIASEYRYNITYGMRILIQKWQATPRIGDGDPSVLEDWYYAVWAYNGWGWVNNPNNPRFTRQATPAIAPSTYPYQERVLYLVAHPPHDAEGNPLWAPVPVSLPSRSVIGSSPGHFVPAKQHRQPPPVAAAVYEGEHLAPVTPAGEETVRVHLVNTGTEPWLASGTNAIRLTYHLLTLAGNPWTAITPFSTGVLAFGQHPVGIGHDVVPGNSVTVSMAVQAPGQPGTYRVAWDLEQGAGLLFSQLRSLPRARLLVVRRPAAIPPPPPPTAVPTPPRLEDLRYLIDTSLADGSTVLEGRTYVKGWLVLNDGVAAWGPGWHLQHVAGQTFGVAHVSVPATAGCHTATILVQLRVPGRSGNLTGVWQLRDPQGHAVGDRLTVRVAARKSGPGPQPSPTASATPTAVATPMPTATPTPVG
jgi:hypothetical protein